MKIFVDRELLVQMLGLLLLDGAPRSVVTDIIKANLETILRENPEPQKGICVICGEETNDRTSALDLNYCPTCWNSGRRLNENI